MLADREVFTEIFNELYPRLCRFLECLLGSSSLAQDIAQESLLRLYRFGVDRLPHEEIRFWVFRVARNLAHNELKRKQTQMKLLDRLAGWLRPYQSNTAEKELVRAEEANLLWRLLKSLPEDQRTALLLREQEEMSYREIARVTGVSESKVKIDIYRGRNLLREKWQEQNRSSPRLERRFKHRRD
ncbi:MAG: sigma-70 family RNA polymerase sigma factor [Acidobacteriota bacterium]